MWTFGLDTLMKKHLDTRTPRTRMMFFGFLLLTGIGMVIGMSLIKIEEKKADGSKSTNQANLGGYIAMAIILGLATLILVIGNPFRRSVIGLAPSVPLITTEK